MIRQNLHTHSRYCDGQDCIEDMIKEAIKKGFSVLGFSGHGICEKARDWSMDEIRQEKYKKDVLEMKEKYKDQISIYLGVEQDLMGNRFSKDEYDFIIGSVHIIKVSDGYKDVDLSKKTTQSIVDDYGSFLNYAKAYYDEVIKLKDSDEVDIIGHIDVLMKFNEDESFIAFDDPEYLKIAYRCIDELIKANKIFEVNTGAIARSYRTKPYPHHLLLKYIYGHGGKICLNSDCHQKEMLDCNYKEALEYIKNCGFTSMMELTDEGFIERPVADFQ